MRSTWPGIGCSTAVVVVVSVVAAAAGAHLRAAKPPRLAEFLILISDKSAGSLWSSAGGLFVVLVVALVGRQSGNR